MYTYMLCPTTYIIYILYTRPYKFQISLFKLYSTTTLDNSLTRSLRRRVIKSLDHNRSRYAHDIFRVVNYTITHEFYLVYGSNYDFQRQSCYTCFGKIS